MIDELNKQLDKWISETEGLIPSLEKKGLTDAVRTAHSHIFAFDKVRDYLQKQQADPTRLTVTTTGIKKQTFIEAIKAIEQQITYDIAQSEKLAAAFPNAHSANLLPDNHLISNALMKVLQEEMNDTVLCEYGQSWIEWFCFETDFGRESYRLKAFDKEQNVIKLDDAGELYDFLMKR